MLIDLRQTDRIPDAQAQALLDADLACAELGLLYELKCRQCGRAWGSEKTKARAGRILHYEIDCECKRRVYDISQTV